MKEMNLTLLEKLKKYEDRWVALQKKTNEIVGSGKDAVEAKASAEKRGYADVILFRVLPFRGGYVPFA
jgi:Family of unknown function (DUF5678)